MTPEIPVKESGVHFAEGGHQPSPAIEADLKYTNPEYDTIFNRIKTAVDKIWIVDTHEHLVTEGRRMEYPIDFFYLVRGYFIGDLKSSGMSDQEMNFIANHKNPIEERWKVFEPFWEKTKNTAYAQCFRIAAKDLFGVDDINERTYKIVDEKLRATKTGQWYRYVLKEKARIDVSIVDVLSQYSKPEDIYSNEYFLKVKKFDDFIMTGEDAISRIQTTYGVRIKTLRDYLGVLDNQFEKAVREEHIVGIKTTAAYNRSLYFEDVSLAQAEEVFNRLSAGPEVLNDVQLKRLQDFMMHHVIQLAIRYNLPIQIHTGMLSQTGHANPIQNTNAALLTNLFVKYRNAKFVIFHGNYPYMGELAYLAKSFPNVYIDMCWMHIIAPSASKRFLEEWLFTVPANKIMAFGGDIVKIVEWVYGHSVMARNNVTAVLTKMVEEGYYSESEAISIAKMILRDNALALYHIQKNGAHFYTTADN